MTVLVVTWSGDAPAVAAVCAELRARGVRVCRLDTDRFPSDTRLSFELTRHGGRIRLRTPSDEIGSSDVRAVWHRRSRVAERLPADLAPSMRAACEREAKATLYGWLAQLDAFHLDRDEHVVRASHKPLQLRVAHEIGFEVPDTLITNDADEARRFGAGRPLVAKMLTHFKIHGGAREQAVMTSRVEPADLDDAAGLALCPMVFQAHVEKALELRVIVVADELFAAAIDWTSHAAAAVDWRAQALALADRWRAHELPAEVASRAKELVRRFGLCYGAIDMILTPDGRYVFLEINPQGEFSWLEELGPRFPIHRAIAALLAERAGAQPC